MIKILTLLLLINFGCVNYGQTSNDEILSVKVILLKVDSTFFVKYKVLKACKLSGDSVYFFSPKTLKLGNDTCEVVLERFNIPMDLLEYTLRARYVGFAFSQDDKEVWTNDSVTYKNTLAGTGNLFVVRNVVNIFSK